MKLKIPKIKLDFNHIANDLVFVGILGAILFIGVWWGFKKIGINSYNGLHPDHVTGVYHEFEKRMPVLSKVAGHNALMGGYFERGIAMAKDGSGYPMYFHYTDNLKGGVNFTLYPLMFETWTTDPGLLGIGKFFTGNAVRDSESMDQGPDEKEDDAY
jgi:hypothetical protein